MPERSGVINCVCSQLSCGAGVKTWVFSFSSHSNVSEFSSKVVAVRETVITLCFAVGIGRCFPRYFCAFLQPLINF